MAAALGDFLVNITTKVKDVEAKKLASTLADLTKSATKFGLTLTGSFAASGYGFSRLINSTAQETAELGRLSKDLGVSVDFLQTFTRSFETIGVGADEAIATIRTLKTEIEAFKFGQGHVEAFGILGLNPQNFGDDVSKNFDVVRKRFNTLTDLERLYFVTQIGLGEKSLRVLRLNDEEYKNLLSTSRQAPLATDKQIKDSEKYTENINRLSQSFDGLKRNILVETLPTFEKFIDRLDSLFQDKNFQQNIGKFFDVIFTQFEKLVDNPNGVVEKLEKFANALTGIASAIQAIGSMVNGFVEGSSWVGQKVADLIDAGIDSVTLPNKKKDAINRDKQKHRDAIKSGMITTPDNFGSLIELNKNAIFGTVNQMRGQTKATTINNFNNKTDIQIENARKDQDGLVKAIPQLIDETYFSSGNKITSQNFKKGVIR